MTPAEVDRVDVVLVGGGLQSALLALALRARRSELRVAIVERDPVVGGDHLWSFHAADVPPSCAAWVEPLVVRRWPAYDVRFEGLERRIDQPYASISSCRLAEVVGAWSRHPRALLLQGLAAVRLDADGVVLEDGTVLRADLVVDARGPSALPTEGRVAFQKFVGLELELTRPAPRTIPLLMDAQVPQADGFRFVYVLPLDAHRVLVEDTYFSDSPVLDEAYVAGEALAYAERQGYRVASVARRERGVLPLPLRAPSAFATRGPLVAGYAGGFFHPTTGYSFPAAVRLAECVASSPPASVLASPSLGALIAKQRAQARFAAFLNRMLYSAFAPEDRWNVLARFYRLPEATITRFYALETSAVDRARIVCGRPPRGIDVALAIGSRGVA